MGPYLQGGFGFRVWGKWRINWQRTWNMKWKLEVIWVRIRVVLCTLTLFYGARLLYIHIFTCRYPKQGVGFRGLRKWAGVAHGWDLRQWR